LGAARFDSDSVGDQVGPRVVVLGLVVEGEDQDGLQRDRECDQPEDAGEPLVRTVATVEGRADDQPHLFDERHDDQQREHADDRRYQLEDEDRSAKPFDSHRRSYHLYLSFSGQMPVSNQGIQPKNKTSGLTTSVNHVIRLNIY
jgi:hypothetical protein